MVVQCPYFEFLDFTYFNQLAILFHFKLDYYEWKVEAILFNDSANMNKKNNHLSRQTMEYKKDLNIWGCKCLGKTEKLYKTVKC